MLLLARRARGQRPLVLDGAIGTELIARGLELGREPPEAWTRDRPELLRELHGAYVAAGVGAIQTNTFGASRPRLAQGKLDGAIADLNRRAVELARAAAIATPVIASLGPTGIDPFGGSARREIAAAYDEQLALLVAARVDALHFETMYHPVEAVEAIRAARRADPRATVILSATFALGDLGFQTPLGVPVDAMLRAVEDAGPDAVGLNCSLEARKMVGLVRRVRDLTDLPLVVQPQGAPAQIDCRAPRVATVETDVADFVRGVLACLDAGADIVGGCCGAGPRHMCALVDAVGSTAAPVG